MRRFVAIAAITVGIGAWMGCKDARLSGAAIKPAVVVDVTDGELSLDKNASPEMVAFALLRAIRDDVQAGTDLAAREAAFDRQYRLAAPAAIHQRHVLSFGEEHAELDESVYKTVHAWAPTLGYYADNFAFTWEEARQAMKSVIVPAQSRENLTKAEERHVLLKVRDIHDDPNASAVVRIRLVQEEGRWRVWWAGFDHARRGLAALRAPAAATQPTG